MGQFKIIIEYQPDAHSVIQNKLAIQAIVTEECVQSTDIGILEHTTRDCIKQILMVYETELDNIKYAPNRNLSMKSIYDHNYYGSSNA